MSKPFKISPLLELLFGYFFTGSRIETGEILPSFKKRNWWDFHRLFLFDFSLMGIFDRMVTLWSYAHTPYCYFRLYSLFSLYIILYRIWLMKISPVQLSETDENLTDFNFGTGENIAGKRLLNRWEFDRLTGLGNFRNPPQKWIEFEIY